MVDLRHPLPSDGTLGARLDRTFAVRPRVTSQECESRHLHARSMRTSFLPASVRLDDSARSVWSFFAGVARCEPWESFVRIGNHKFAFENRFRMTPGQKPNKAPEPTPGAVTPRATECTSK
jgi:hypothetical protein